MSKRLVAKKWLRHHDPVAPAELYEPTIECLVEVSHSSCDERHVPHVEPSVSQEYDCLRRRVLAQVSRLDQLPQENRLNPERVVADSAATGRPAFY